MKIRFIADSGPPTGQFIVTAENDAECGVLRAFCAFPGYAKEKWVFTLHGPVYTDGKVTDFNFGYTSVDPKNERNRA